MNGYPRHSEAGTPSMKYSSDRWKFYALIAVVGGMLVVWVVSGLVKKVPQPTVQKIYRVMSRGDAPYGMHATPNDTNWWVMEFNGNGTIRYIASWHSQSNAWSALIGTNVVSWPWQ